MWYKEHIFIVFFLYYNYKETVFNLYQRNGEVCWKLTRVAFIVEEIINRIEFT